jgi:hypothetical protein
MSHVSKAQPCSIPCNLIYLLHVLSTTEAILRCTIMSTPQARSSGVGKGGWRDNIWQSWSKSLEKNQDSRDALETEVETHLYKPIKMTLRTAHNAGHRKVAVTDITEFLTDPSSTTSQTKLKDPKIDDCIRWLVLYLAVQETVLEQEDKDIEPLMADAKDENIDTETNVYILITRIILSIAPYLAFMNPTTSPQLDSEVRNSCIQKTGHEIVTKKVKTTPFHEAAANGNGKAIKYMVHEGSLKVWPNQRREFIDIIRRKDPGPYAKTALRLAALEAKDGLGALHALLNFDTGVAKSLDGQPPDDTFKEALLSGRTDVVDVFLGKDELWGTYITSDNLLDAMDRWGRLPPNDTQRETLEKAIKSLITHVNSPSVVNHQVVEKIIELNLTDVWHSKIKLEPSGLLHLAVRHQSVFFVNEFLQQYDHLVTEKKEGYYPLWHNNKVFRASRWEDREEPTEERKRIRNAIVPATIKKVQEMQKLSAIFQDSFENGEELSRFLRPSYFQRCKTHQLL